MPFWRVATLHAAALCLSSSPGALPSPRMKEKGKTKRAEARGGRRAEKGKKRAEASWCFEAEELLVPGLDNDIALRCLAFVPTYLHPLLASLNKTYHRLIVSVRAAPLMHLRRTLGLVDHLLISRHPLDFDECEVVHIDGEEQTRVKVKRSLRVLDVKRNTWLNLAVPPFISWNEYDTFFCSGTRLFCFSYSLANVGIHYDFVKHKWEVCYRMLEPTRRSCAFASSGDCCFVAGGHRTNGRELTIGKNLQSAEMYSMGENKWRRLPAVSAARHECAGFFMDNKFYVMGGTDYSGRHSFEEVEEYDLSTKVWRTIHGMCLIGSSKKSPLVAVHNNQLYGIDDIAALPCNPTLHVYEKQAKTWRSLGPILDKHGEGVLYIRNGGLISMDAGTLLVVGEWWPRVRNDAKRLYVLSWEASPEAIACEFKIVHSGEAEPPWCSEELLLELLGPQEEPHLRLCSEPWVAAVI